MKKHKIIVEKTSTGFSAYANKYPVYTTGRSLKELSENIIEALNFYFNETKGTELVAKRNLNLFHP